MFPAAAFPGSQSLETAPEESGRWKVGAGVVSRGSLPLRLVVAAAPLPGVMTASTSVS